MFTESEFNNGFTDKMRASMEVSYHKYGPIRQAYPHKVDAIKNLKKRLDLYEQTGNADYLVDIANFAMIEYTLPAHPKNHYSPTDGGEGRVWSNGKVNQLRNDGERI